MKPVIFSIFAMVFYAVSNVLLESKLSKYNTFTLMISYLSVILFISILGRFLIKTNDGLIFEFPTGWQLLLVIALGVIMFAADAFYIGAYTVGRGSIMTITCITVMFPVFAALIKFVINRDLPNMWQISGFALAAMAIMLVAKGNIVQEDKKKNLPAPTMQP